MAQLKQEWDVSKEIDSEAGVKVQLDTEGAAVVVSYNEGGHNQTLTDIGQLIAFIAKTPELCALLPAAEPSPLVVGFGPDDIVQSWQAPFPKETKCCACGKTSRLALSLRETGARGKQVSKVHANDPKGTGFWLHDQSAYAIYLCTDINCNGSTPWATCLYNQG